MQMSWGGGRSQIHPQAAQLVLCFGLSAMARKSVAALSRPPICYSAVLSVTVAH